MTASLVRDLSGEARRGPQVTQNRLPAWIWAHYTFALLAGKFCASLFPFLDGMRSIRDFLCVGSVLLQARVKVRLPRVVLSSQ